MPSDVTAEPLVKTGPRRGSSAIISPLFTANCTVILALMNGQSGTVGSIYGTSIIKKMHTRFQMKVSKCPAFNFVEL